MEEWRKVLRVSDGARRVSTPRIKRALGAQGTFSLSLSLSVMVRERRHARCSLCLDAPGLQRGSRQVGKCGRPTHLNPVAHRRAGVASPPSRLQTQGVAVHVRACTSPPPSLQSHIPGGGGAPYPPAGGGGLKPDIEKIERRAAWRAWRVLPLSAEGRGEREGGFAVGRLSRTRAQGQEGTRGRREKQSGRPFSPRAETRSALPRQRPSLVDFIGPSLSPPHSRCAHGAWASPFPPPTPTGR